MKEQVYILNEYQQKEVEQNFEEYTVLAFLSTLLVTLLAWLVLARCVYVSLRNDDEMTPNRNKVCPLPKRDIDTLSYDSEFPFEDDRDGEEELVEMQSLKNVEDDDGDSETIESLETNYVEPKQPPVDLTDSNVSKGPPNVGSDIINPEITDNTLASLFDGIFMHTTVNRKACDLKAHCLLEYVLEDLCAYREVCINEVLYLTFRRLCDEYVVSEDVLIRLTSKYEQMLEDSRKGMRNVEQSSRNILKICDLLAEDLQPHYDEKLIEDLRNNVLTISIDCLKTLPNRLSGVTELSLYLAVSVQQTVLYFDKRLFFLFNRFKSFMETAREISEKDISNVMSNYQSGFVDYLQTLAPVFRQELRKCVRNLNVQYLRALQALAMRHTREMRRLGEQSSKEMDRIDFEGLCRQQVMFLAVRDEQFQETMVGVCERETRETKNIFDSMLKGVSQTLESLEGEFYTSISDFADENRIVKHDKNFKQMLRETHMDLTGEVKMALEDFEKHVSQNLQNWSQLVDFLTKKCSSLYRKQIRIFTRVLRSIQCLSKQERNSLLLNYKGQMMVKTFDLFFAQVLNFFQCLQSSRASRDDNYVEILLEDVKYFQQDEENRTESTPDFLCKLKDQMSRINEKFLAENFNQQIEQLHEKLEEEYLKETENFEVKTLQPTVTTALSKLCNDHNDVFKIFENLLREPEKKKKRSLTSRKSRLSAQKTQRDDLIALYERHVGMKETKMEKMDSQEIIRTTKSKGSGVKSRMTLLDGLKVELDNEQENECEIDKHYMVNRLVKSLIEYKTQ